MNSTPPFEKAVLPAAQFRVPPISFLLDLELLVPGSQFHATGEDGSIVFITPSLACSGYVYMVRVMREDRTVDFLERGINVRAVDAVLADWQFAPIHPWRQRKIDPDMPWELAYPNQAVAEREQRARITMLAATEALENDPALIDDDGVCP